MIVRLILFLLLLLISIFSSAQTPHNAYEISEMHPYGQINPEAPSEMEDYAALIGISDCSSESRNADKSWATPVAMTWKFKYIMNGMAIQDETIKADGSHSGSIRQYSKDSAQWYVHYYSSAAVAAKLSVWEGHKKGKDMVLYNEQKAPNGTDGFYRLTFANITDQGFNWIGEWVTKDESFSYPTWKISCKKRK